MIREMGALAQHDGCAVLFSDVFKAFINPKYTSYQTDLPCSMLWCHSRHQYKVVFENRVAVQTDAVVARPRLSLSFALCCHRHNVKPTTKSIILNYCPTVYSTHNDSLPCVLLVCDSVS